MFLWRIWANVWFDFVFKVCHLSKSCKQLFIRGLYLSICQGIAPWLGNYHVNCHHGLSSFPFKKNLLVSLKVLISLLPTYTHQMLFSIVSFSFLTSSVISQGCTPLLIDDYSRANNNAINGYSSDDGTMGSVSFVKNALSLSAKSSGSYFYEEGFCVAKKNNVSIGGWAGVQLTVTPSASASSFVIDLQTGRDTGCNNNYANNEISTTTLKFTLAAGQAKLVQIPFTAWPQANLNNIKAVLVSTFNPLNSKFVFGPMSFYCAVASTTTVAGTTTVSTLASTTSTTVSATATSVTTTVPAPTTTTTIATTLVSTVSSTIAATTTTLIASPSPSPTGTVTKDLVIEDFLDSQRLSFLGYNALVPPQASSDDGTMASLIVTGARGIFVTKPGSYFYTQLGCLNALTAGYEGIAFTLVMPSASALSMSTFLEESDKINTNSD